MTELISSLAKIARRYDAVLCDLWGCLHDGKQPFPEAVAALQALRRGGGKVILLTNAPRPRGSVVAQLDRMGVPRDAWDEVVTSGDATQYALFSGTFGTRAFFVGATKDEPFFTDLPADLTPAAITRVEAEAADVMICTGLAHDLTETPADYRLPLMRAKTAGLTMLCANPDIVVDYGAQRLYCAGALAADYEKMGGKTMYFGKPHPPIYDLARRRLGELGGGRNPQILCIGDGIGTDIQGGMAEGLDTLFVTGGISATEFGPDPNAPDKGLLEKWLIARQMSATFSIAKLR
ncbi:TIGR01459 family HAD-type hydrolase [bacterium]|nr:TIGR01459 family HAD-type hydrolase [bacterium]